MNKKRYKKILIALCCVLLFVATVVSSVPRKSTAYAATDTSFGYYMLSYDISCTLNADCSASVTETVSMNQVSGNFARYIPVRSGARVRDAEMYVVTEGENGEEILTTPGYTVSKDAGNVVIRAKESSVSSGAATTYRFTYRYVNLPLTSGGGFDTVELPLVGFDWPNSPRNVKIEVSLPASLSKDGDGAFRIEAHSKTSDGEVRKIYSADEYETDGDGVTISVVGALTRGYDISFALSFDKGVMKRGVPDILPWLLLLIGLVLVAALLAVKLTLFKGEPVVEGKRAKPAKGGETFVPRGDEQIALENPAEGLDPLDVKRALERKIESRDAVSVVFSLAERGCMKIYAKDENNPVFVRTAEKLPGELPESWQGFYAAIFEKGDRAGLKGLRDRTRVETDKIRGGLNAKRPEYKKSGIISACVFAVLAALFVSFLPVFLPMTMSRHAFSPVYFVATIPALVIFVFFAGIYVSRRKNTRAVTAAMSAVALLVGAACVALYVVLVPDGVLALEPKIFCALLTFATELGCVTLITHTDDCEKKHAAAAEVKDIVTGGARERSFSFESSELYFRLLPYAQALGAENSWTDRFADATFFWPSWIVRDDKNFDPDVMKKLMKSVRAELDG